MAELQPHTEPHPDVAGYLLATLDPTEAQAFAEHLPRCQACRDDLAAMAALPGLLADAPPAEVLPAGLEQRTFAAIEVAAQAAAVEPATTEAGAAQAPAAAAVEPATTEAGAAQVPAAAAVEPATTEAGGAPSAAVVPIERARSSRRRGPGRIVSVAAAALVAVALGVGVLASVGTSGQAPVATIQLISVTGGPAHATAIVRTAPGGLSIDMRVGGLPPSPPGTIYTCWLVGPGDTLAHQNRVSVGSFVVGAGGAVHVHWTTAADLHRFPHLGVTREPNDGDPRHQGPKVLAGP